MEWIEGPMAAFDVETTGVDTESDRIVTASVAIVGRDRETELLDWLIDPGVEIPKGATDVHGITTERVRSEGLDASEAISAITETLSGLQADDVPIIAFNARFDLTMLDREARRYGIEPLIERVGGPDGLLVIDPFVLDKQCNKFRRGQRTLTILCEERGIALVDAHASNADALAAARLAWCQMTKEEMLSGFDLPTLHESQIQWAREQAIDLEEYFRRKGRDEKVDRDWPLIPVAA